MFTVQVDALMPTLREEVIVGGVKVISCPGHVGYRSLRFTGDQFVRTAVIARFMANDRNPSRLSIDIAISPENYWSAYDRR